jgi:hypothetical protein
MKLNYEATLTSLCITEYSRTCTSNQARANETFNLHFHRFINVFNICGADHFLQRPHRKWTWPYRTLSQQMHSIFQAGSLEVASTKR